MKLFLKMIILLILAIQLNAQMFSLNVENDVVDGEDRHYSNGISLMYLSENDTNNLEKYDNKLYKLISKTPTLNDDLKYQSLGVNLSHFTFTPSNIESKEKLIGDLPYAGIFMLDFILYKWNEKLFHEYILSLGMVGPSTQTDKVHDKFHNITNATNPLGWNNQLEDDFLYNFTYTFGHKTYRNIIGKNKFDLINSVSLNMGNFNKAIQIGSILRYGNNYPDNFNTVGRLIGGNEHKLLNLEVKNKTKFAWSVSYGLAYSYIDYFYVNDFDKSYENEKIGNTLTQIAGIDGYWDKWILSFMFKSSDFAFKNNSPLKNNWGGISITYLF